MLPHPQKVISSDNPKLQAAQEDSHSGGAVTFRVSSHPVQPQCHQPRAATAGEGQKPLPTEFYWCESQRCCWPRFTWTLLLWKGVAVKMSSWLSLGSCSRNSLICCFLLRVPTLAVITASFFSAGSKQGLSETAALGLKPTACHQCHSPVCPLGKSLTAALGSFGVLTQVLLFPTPPSGEGHCRVTGTLSLKAGSGNAQLSLYPWKTLIQSSCRVGMADTREWGGCADPTLPLGAQGPKSHLDRALQGAPDLLEPLRLSRALCAEGSRPIKVFPSH